MCPANNPTTASPARSAEVERALVWLEGIISGPQSHSATLHRHIASLEASQPTPDSTNYCASCGFHTGTSHDWKECEKSRLALIFPSQPKGHASDCAVHNMPAYPNGPCDCGLEPKPQSDGGLRELLAEARDEIRPYRDADTRDDEFDRHDDECAALRMRIDAALSRQAPVPTRSDESLAHEYAEKLQNMSVDDLEGPLARLISIARQAPVPTSGAVEVANRVLNTCVRHDHFLEYEKAAAIIQQAVDGATALLRQVSAEVCSDCGWAMKFPNEACRKCVADKIEGQPPVADGKLITDKIADMLEHGLVDYDCNLEEAARLNGGHASAKLVSFYSAVVSEIANWIRTEALAQPASGSGHG